MFPFLRVPDSKRLSRIISSHPTFSNVPSGLVTDPFRESLFDIRAPLGSRYFGGFGAREGETIATPAPGIPNYIRRESKDIGLGVDLSRMGVMPPLSQMIEGEEKKTLGPTMTEINKIFESMVSNKKRTQPKQTKVRTNTTRKKEMKKAVRAGIKASQEGDIETAKRVTKREALSAGIPDVLATILEKEAGEAIKKHAKMENKEVDGIVEKVEGERPLKRDEDIKRSGKGRGRPAGSRGSGVKVRQLKDALKNIGYKNVTLNKPQLIGELSEVASRSGVPMEDILEAPVGGTLTKRLIEVAREMGKAQRRYDVKKKLPRRPRNKGPPSTPKKKR